MFDRGQRPKYHTLLTLNLIFWQIFMKHRGNVMLVYFQIIIIMLLAEALNSIKASDCVCVEVTAAQHRIEIWSDLGRKIKRDIT